MKGVQFKQKPYRLLLFPTIVMALISVFASERTLDIHLHDTYFIIGYSFLFGSLAVFSFALWVLYVLSAGFHFSRLLMWIHVAISVVALLAITFLLYSAKGFLQPTSRSYLDFSVWRSAGLYNSSVRIFQVVVLALVLSQAIFPVNLIGGLFKRR